LPKNRKTADWSWALPVDPLSTHRFCDDETAWFALEIEAAASLNPNRRTAPNSTHIDPHHDSTDGLA
jgi:hypothetical protein